MKNKFLSVTSTLFTITISTGCVLDIPLNLTTDSDPSTGETSSGTDTGQGQTEGNVVPTTGMGTSTTSDTEDSSTSSGTTGTMGTTNGEDTNGIPVEGVLQMPVCQNSSFTQGWYTTPDREEVINETNHNAVDIGGEWGAPVYAPADGWALASYEIYPILSQRGQVIGLGGGLLVEFYHPELNLGSQLLHLSAIDEIIPYYAPEPYVNDEGYDAWLPTAIVVPPEVLIQNGVPVAKGDLIGYMGRSGLLTGDQEEPSAMPNISEASPSWDEIHVHFAVYEPRDAEGKRGTRYDPTGLYSGDLEAYNLTLIQCTAMFECDPVDPLAPRFPKDCANELL